jgi:aminomethyltransferase
LLFFPFDMPKPDTTPWEVNMDWAISRTKGDYRGKAAVMASEGRERFKNVGITIDHHQAINPGAKIIKDGHEIGTVNSTTYSQHLMLSIGLAHVPPNCVGLGTSFTVKDGGHEYAARVVQIPFYDPLRLRSHPVAH